MFNLPSPLSVLDLSSFGVKQQVYVKRDDLIHPVISGNKWRKLKNNIHFFLNNSFCGIVSKGGAYSSHIQSLSLICNLKAIPCVILVRGQEPNVLNDILKQCLANNAVLLFLNRQDYCNTDYVQELISTNWPNYYFIPDGASNFQGIKGCQEIINELTIDFDEIYCEVGSGATVAGLASSCHGKQKVYGVVVLKGAENINHHISNNYFCLFDKPLNPNIKYLHQYHFGGYAKHSNELIQFIREFFEVTGIKTDPIYSGKLFYALIDQLKKNSNSKKTVIALHSGGLSGIPGYEKRYKLKLFN